MPAVDVSKWSALDTAWSEAVVLPEGWQLIRLEKDGTRVEFIGGRSEWVAWWEAEAEGPDEARQIGVGTWPVMALHDLAGKFQNREDPS